ncbi:MAG: hypothetical protein FWC91_02720 [Defluviitaleaceae bacterium]|nr:hypothetical protein [Defluviitaleaceae bacterium]
MFYGFDSWGDGCAGGFCDGIDPYFHGGFAPGRFPHHGFGPGFGHHHFPHQARRRFCGPFCRRRRW